MSSFAILMTDHPFWNQRWCHCVHCLLRMSCVLSFDQSFGLGISKPLWQMFCLLYFVWTDRFESVGTTMPFAPIWHSDSQVHWCSFLCQPESLSHLKSTTAWECDHVPDSCVIGVASAQRIEGTPLADVTLQAPWEYSQLRGIGTAKRKGGTVPLLGLSFVRCYDFTPCFIAL